MVESLHPFEEAGLGLAPFRFVGYEKRVGPIRLADGITEIGAPGQPMGMCDFCGQGIAHCMHIESSDSRRFVVGCDCVHKLQREDNQLASAAKRLRAKIRRDDARRKADERRAMREELMRKELDAQRNRNGGLTDSEVEHERRETERLEAERKHATENAWLIDALIFARRSDFLDGILRDLRRRPLSSFSDRCLDIVCDIWCKTTTGGARRNSKRYKIQEQIFEDNCERTPATN